MNKMNIKKGDLVQVISGKDRGPAGSPTQGKVMRAMPAERKIVVEGVGIVKKSVKPNGAKGSNRIGAVTIQPRVALTRVARCPSRVSESSSAIATMTVMVAL